MTLSNNRISEFAEVEKLGELPALVELNLMSNTIARKQNYRTYILKRLINLLSIDGKEITMDERRRFQEVAGINIDPKQ